jgi:hypothetical protein
MTRWMMTAAMALTLGGGCTDVEKDKDGDHDHENEVITTVALTFTPAGGGAATTFEWADPENDGSPVIDDIALEDASGDGTHAAQTYGLTVKFLNGLEDPAEDITAEVEDESDQHQVFFTGTGVEGPATGENAAAVVSQSYDDEDAGGLPVGLSNTFTTLALGSGELTVTLRHLPPEDGNDVKVAGTAEDVAEGGFEAIGGTTDASVTFPIEVR